MKLLNKKGFALVETLIVTTFVMSMFILVYQNVVPMLGEYEKMSNYDDIDSIYAANLYKQVVLRYVNLTYVDSVLNDNTYVDITNCGNTDIYSSRDYCDKIKNILSIKEDDYIFITKYDISSFREEVKENEFFDSGRLSNFKGYINTVGDVDSFYDSTDTTQNITGKYRLFVTRTVTNSDQSTTLKYTNLGIFLGNYQKYKVGDLVTFDPGDGNRDFYVLHDSPSNESTVTLIMKDNFDGATTYNDDGSIDQPTNALSLLREKTNGWDNVVPFTTLNDYITGNNNTISYNGYNARLLNANDIYNVLGCSDDLSCFDVNSLFSTSLNNYNLTWLYNGLTDDKGYWLANSIKGTDMVWSIQNGEIKPVIYNNSADIGVRPVIVVSKDKLSVGDSL